MRMTSGWVGVTLAMAALSSGCSGGASAEQRAELQESKARWRERGPDDYVFVVDSGGFAPAPILRVVVEGARLVTAVDVSNGLPDEYWTSTMTDMLETAEDAAEDAYRFDASYDPDLGYLIMLNVDSDEDGEDDGFSYFVTCFEEGTSDASCPLPQQD